MEYYRDELGVKNLYQYPNSVIPGDYPKAQLAPRTDGKVRILWQGGGSHMPDWFPLRDAVREVCVRYPQAVFVIWGTNFRWIHDNIPDGQIEFVNWVGYDGYKAYRTLIDADINLCPLVNNIFNRGKSCIKWYEGSILSRPEATLAANERPYSEEMVDGETGLLYDHPDEFVQKLGALIESAELRQRLGENAKKWVLENRLYTKTAVGLHEFYQELRARKERESLLEV
jgi:glycosyltransferase involved in cell wall biosynthesis